MNKKKQKKNDLRSSIILLLLLLLLLISATYAWFTANQTVKISSIDVRIEAQNGLQISTDASTWKSIITNTDITTGYGTNGTDTNQLPTSMEPVSTIGEVVGDRMRMFYGIAAPDDNDDGKYKLTATEETYEGDQNTTDKDPGTQKLLDDGTRKYVAFDVFLKVDADTQIQLGLGSNVIKTDKADNSDKGIKQASRVAFCVIGNKPVGTSVTDLIAITGGTTSYIWEPNANWHTSAANEHAKANYGVTTDLKTDGTEAAIAYYGIKEPISKANAEILKNTNASYFSAVTPAYITSSDATGETMVKDLKTDTAIDKGLDIFPLSAGITKVRIYMWIEGQDYDCENTASGTDISYNLQIQVKQ